MEKLENAFQPVYTKEQIHSHKLKETIYLKSKTWGISADHRIYVISTNRDTKFEPSESSEYVFRGFDDLFYRQTEDSITFYVTQIPNVPEIFSTKFQLEFVELSNPEFTQLRIESKYGIQRFEY